MNDFVHKPNSGSLVRNDRKTADNQPDHRGTASIRCPHCQRDSVHLLSAWVNTTKASGQRYFGIKFNVEQERAPQAAPVPEPPKQPVPEFPDDQVPF